jgi:hypothetical protein
MSTCPPDKTLQDHINRYKTSDVKSIDASLREDGGQIPLIIALHGRKHES